MGAYGDVTCSSCGEQYFELDEHMCCALALKARICELEDALLDVNGISEELYEEVRRLATENKQLKAMVEEYAGNGS